MCGDQDRCSPNTKQEARPTTSLCETTTCLVVERRTRSRPSAQGSSAWRLPRPSELRVGETSWWSIQEPGGAVSGHTESDCYVYPTDRKLEPPEPPSACLVDHLA